MGKVTETQPRGCQVSEQPNQLANYASKTDGRYKPDRI